MTKIKAIILSAVLMLSTIMTGCFGSDTSSADNLSTLKAAAAELEIAAIADSDLTLPTTVEGYEGLTISYKSENVDIISDEGKVKRQKEDTSVKLTATLKLNGTTYNKNFLIKVPAAIPDTVFNITEFKLTPNTNVNSVGVMLNFKGDFNAYGNAETRKIQLILSYLNDDDVKTEKQYVSTAKSGFEFEINLDTLLAQSRLAHLTLILQEDDHEPRTVTPLIQNSLKEYGISNQAVDINIFEITSESGYAVIKISQTKYCDDILLPGAIRVMSDRSRLANSSLVNSFASLTDDAVLANSVADGYGSTIIWTTSNASVITSKGVITRPPVGSADATAKLTATLKIGDKSISKIFDVKVKAKTSTVERFDGVRIYQTASQQNNYFTKLSDKSFDSVTATGVEIAIDSANKTNEIQGFGGMLSHGTAYLLRNTDTVTRATIIHELFSPDGAGFNVIRLPIGACDFPTYVGAVYDVNGVRTKDGVLENFSLCDNKGESDLLENFSINVDLQELIPIIIEIQSVNPDMVFVATPWSAPGWMKTTNSLCGGWLKGPSNDVNYEPVYAKYLTKYLQAYSDQGIEIEYLSLQNEPQHQDTTYPTMQMHQETQKRLAKLLGDEFKANNLDTKLIILDHNTNMADYALDVLKDANARPYISGVGIHGYSGGLTSMDEANNKYAPLGKSEYQGFVDEIKEAYPDTEFYFTEMTAGNSGSFNGNINWAAKNIILPSVSLGSKFTLYFNFVLDENGMPFIRQDWVDRGYNCVGLAELNTNGTVAYNAEYYALKHVSKFSQATKKVVNGTTKTYLSNNLKCSVSDSNLTTAATITAEGKIALTLNNSGSTDKNISIKYNGKYMNFTAAKNSLTTFVWYE